MVMRSQSKEKALANLTSKFMSHNDQPVNCPLRECIAGLTKENLIFSVVSYGRLCHLRISRKKC